VLRVNKDRLHDTDDAIYLRVEVVVRVGRVLHTGKEGNEVTAVGLTEAVDDARETSGCSLSVPGGQGCPMRSGNIAPRLGPIRSGSEGGGCPSERNLVRHGSLGVVVVKTAERLGERE
jgi:hypothetical protein